MSVWREIRCDDTRSDRCWNKTNKGPAGFESVSDLRRRSLVQGWELINKYDRCPACHDAMMEARK